MKFYAVFDNQDKVDNVFKMLRASVKRKNLFGYREYMEDLLEDIYIYMEETKYKFSTTIYVRAGMQAAIDKSRYCSAKKRRGNYELCSIDDLYDLCDESDKQKRHTQELLWSIEKVFGKDFAKGLSDILSGNGKATAEEKAKYRNTRFRKFLEDYRGE